MSCYIVTFEVATAQAREAVQTKLKTYSGFCPIHSTCWAILTDQKSENIRDLLMPVCGPTDRIFVVRSGTEAAWANLYGQANTDWLKKNL